MRKILRRVIRAPGAAPGVLPGALPATTPEPQVPPVPEDWTEQPLPVPRGKRLISLRLDADVVAYFQQGGKGYQTRMNAVLRAWMEARRRRQS